MTVSLRKPHPKQYIAWENVDIEWGWALSDIDKVVALWAEGRTAEDISRETGRPFIEVWLLIANLIWSNQIKPKAKIFCLPYGLRPKKKTSLLV
jgi:hypothetical protein